MFDISYLSWFQDKWANCLSCTAHYWYSISCGQKLYVKSNVGVSSMELGCLLLDEIYPRRMDLDHCFPNIFVVHK